jgi:hypothetical protein
LSLAPRLNNSHMRYASLIKHLNHRFAKNREKQISNQRISTSLKKHVPDRASEAIHVGPKFNSGHVKLGPMSQMKVVVLNLTSVGQADFNCD